MSGFFPAQHGVKYTLEANMPYPTYPDQVPLSTSLANIATVMSAAGYNVVYKGKWHCSKPAGSTWTPADLQAYGWQRWNPDDAGANQSIPEMGGGSAQNDARFVGSETTNYQDGNEGILQYINSEAAQQAPFFLICSLVNPHDVLAYPKSYETAGYSDIWLEGDIGLPATVMEDLSTKPRAQQLFLKLSAGLGILNTRKKKQNYLNFYGSLMKWSDEYLVNIMAALKQQGLFDNTVIIRTSDHGEMGLTHGGMRQKNFNFYEETIRIPLVWSNPTLYKKAYATDAMVSHVDFLPTIASLFNAPSSARAPWQGEDYSSIVLNPRAKPVQEMIIFTYDDWQAGQANGPYIPPPQHIVAIRGQRWKLAEYWDATGKVPSEFEMYDLLTDPLETVNIAHKSYDRTPEQDVQFARMLKKLQTAKSTRLQPLS
jgi:arylsulfatase A-like enzyme